ncbi:MULTISPECIES: alpha/beta fold hydrolase [Nocardioides]|uniref:Alpha/beta fold hydrolase n=1 Tax=Nocardioides vastitatis TaxID=2568655 RepID=A0ABW0ZF93_9ACTN|nr:alpha/beta hydrolase [Nocardioides sp.]THI97091.1 alpha/beta hydrolase [Nocardioides sp.]
MASVVRLDDTTLEVLDLGSGEPVLLIQTGLTADELLPVARDPAVNGFRRLVQHRRGYARSGPAVAPASVARDAADCIALLDACGIAEAHVLGYSYSGAVALDLASMHPSRVTSLAVVEPPPLIAAYRDDFRAVNHALLALRREAGVDAALEIFWDMLSTPAWWAALEPQVPDARSQMRQDAATFFDGDLPALLAWEFGDEDAARVSCPVLHVGGDASGPWWAAVREQVLAWFPDAADLVVRDADHGLMVTHSAEVAAGLAAFWGAPG